MEAAREAAFEHDFEAVPKACVAEDAFEARSAVCGLARKEDWVIGEVGEFGIFFGKNGMSGRCGDSEGVPVDLKEIEGRFFGPVIEARRDGEIGFAGVEQVDGSRGVAVEEGEVCVWKEGAGFSDGVSEFVGDAGGRGRYAEGGRGLLKVCEEGGFDRVEALD